MVLDSFLKHHLFYHNQSLLKQSDYSDYNDVQMSLQYDRLYVDGRCYGWSQAQGRVLEQGVMYFVCVHVDSLFA